jgi:hypothetical protein
MATPPRQRGPHDYLYILRSCAGRRAISRRETLFAMPEGKMDPCGRRGAAKILIRSHCWPGRATSTVTRCREPWQFSG